MKPIKSKEEQFNEIIFENRNKEYGAYALRTSYKKRMIIAISVSLTVFLLAVTYPLIAGLIYPPPIIPENHIIDVELYNKVNKTEDFKKPPELPKETEKRPVINIKVVNEEVENPEELVQDELNKKTINEIPTEEVITVVNEKEENKIIEEIKPLPFIIVEEMPSYPGGDDLRVKFISENISYPGIAKENNIQGTVYISFIVENDGSISDVKILRGIGGGCDEEALRVVKMMPKWNPGKQSGKSVRVQYNLPIKFTLQ